MSALLNWFKPVNGLLGLCNMHYTIDLCLDRPQEGNKIRKTENEHLIIVCQNLIGLQS